MSRASFRIPVVLLFALGACAQPSPAADASAPAPRATATASPTNATTGSSTSPTLSPSDSISLDGLAFVRRVDDADQLFVVQPDGSIVDVSHYRPRFEFDAEISLPRWSPDGSRIAYGIGWIPFNTWVANRDGTDDRLVSDVGIFGGWSPDGSEFLVSEFSDVTAPGMVLRTFAVEVETGEAREVLQSPGAAWLPDGRIAYSRWDATGEPTIHVLDLESGEDIEIGQGYGATFSPDGALYAVNTTSPECPFSVIAIANADGSDARSVACGSGPVWSPDGTHLAYSEVIGQGPELALRVMRVDGEQVPIPDVVVEFGIAWGPDGARLVVSSGSYTSEDPAELLLIELESMRVTSLGPGEHPAWAP